MDIVDRLRTVDISWSQEAEWCAEAADEIIKLREENRMRWTRYWDMSQAFERRGNALHRIASMKHDEDFGLPPITDAIKIAQDALEKE